MDLTTFLFGHDAITGHPIAHAWLQLGAMAAMALGSYFAKQAKTN